MKKLAIASKEATKRLGSGLEQLRIANAHWEAKVELIKLSVTDEKVKEFAERNMITHEYARELLESAAIDAATHGEYAEIVRETTLGTEDQPGSTEK
jgi:hypothetical protein